MSNNSLLVDIGSYPNLTNHFDNGSGKKKAVLLFGADWHEACPTLKVVLNALAQQQQQQQQESDIFLFGNIDAEAATDLSDKYDVTAVPTIVLLNGGPDSVLEKLDGVVEPSHVTLAVQRLINAPDGAGISPTGKDNNNNNNVTGSNPTIISSSETDVNKDPQEVLNERLDRLVRADTVMLFMKGSPSAPRCGFSRQAVEILTEHDVPFGSFDILTDEEVRQGLKTYSDWPTYPQIYVKGELMGGLDILKETAAEGPLKEQFGIEGSVTPQETLHDRLSKLVNRHDVMVFMKGLPSAPQCGFSRQIVEILDESDIPYDAFNILQDDEVRQGLKEFSDWPTYPQLYVRGELVGGLDIVKELKESGELHDMLKG